MPWITASRAPAGCVFCSTRDGRDDGTAFLLERTDAAFLMLNAYPYAPGHLMAVVNRHVGDVGELEGGELTAMMRLVQRGVVALTAEYQPGGFNIGINQGRAGGAGIEDHLHMHVVPRWIGDHNFISVVGDARVLPETLDATWQRLRKRLHG
jgi:ATP adenylyltransferase